jgi:hypothetical protein
MSEKTNDRRKELKELQSIKNLLILQLLKSGASSEEIDLATGQGASNIRGMFPNIKKRGKTGSAD